MTEPRAIRLKRLRIRSWRRGTREMDLILGGWSDRNLANISDQDLDLFEALLDESDPEIYDWITGRAPAKARFAALIEMITKSATKLKHPH